MKKALTQQSCADCQFWNISENIDSAGQMHECRRRPPTLRPPMMTPAPDQNDLWFAAFPKTYSNIWCGAYRERKVVKAVPAKRAKTRNRLKKGA